MDLYLALAELCAEVKRLVGGKSISLHDATTRAITAQLNIHRDGAVSAVPHGMMHFDGELRRLAREGMGRLTITHTPPGDDGPIVGMVQVHRDGLYPLDALECYDLIAGLHEEIGIPPPSRVRFIVWPLETAPL
jgi:hypothetical protein